MQRYKVLYDNEPLTATHYLPVTLPTGSDRRL